MINLPCFFLADFSEKKVSVYIHDYANELICIFDYEMKGQCLTLYQICHGEHRLWYD